MEILQRIDQPLNDLTLDNSTIRHQINMKESIASVPQYLSISDVPG